MEKDMKISEGDGGKFEQQVRTQSLVMIAVNF
jgi:hypothetical protein